MGVVPTYTETRPGIRSRPSRGGRKPPVRKSPQGPDPLWAKLSVIIGAIVMVIGGGVVVVPKIASAWFLGDIEQINSIPEELKGADISGAINVLLLGTDDRNEAGVEGSRTDSIVLVHIPAAHDRAFMISLPRDARVPIPAFPDTNYVGGEAKINSAFGYGAKPSGPGPSMWDRPQDLSPAGQARGAALVMKTISGLVPGGLKFNGAAIIDFAGFEAVVQALGGVNMCVDTDLYSIHYYPDGTKAGNPLHEDYGGKYGAGKHYTIGCYDMQPWEALDYSRQRYELPNGDYDRQRHQQQLLKAILKKVISTDTLANFKTVTTLQKAAGDLLTLDRGDNEIQDWVFTLSSLRPDDVVMVKTNGGKFNPLGDGTSDEVLSADTYALLKSVQTDTVFDFLTLHQDWIATDQ